MTQKTLMILRHAKAEPGTAAQDDHERALNARGIAASRLIGAYMHRQHLIPDRVLCSTATRCRQTWEEMAGIIFPSPLVGEEGRVGGDSPRTQASSMLQSPPLPNPPPQGGRGLVQYDKKLYLASGNETLNLIAQTPEEVNTLLIIGHNPGFHQLCLKLAKSGDEVLLDMLAIKFSTCALAVIALDPPWRSIPRAHGRLMQHITPKMLAGGEED